MYAGSCNWSLGKLIPVLLPESLALAMGDKLPVLSFVHIILDVSFLNSEGSVWILEWVSAHKRTG